VTNPSPERNLEAGVIRKEKMWEKRQGRRQPQGKGRYAGCWNRRETKIDYLKKSSIAPLPVKKKKGIWGEPWL